MKLYITAGAILLMLGMACEDRKRVEYKKPLETPPTVTEVTSSPEVNLPSVALMPHESAPTETHVDQTTQEKNAAPSSADSASEKPIKLAAKIAPVQYEDVAGRVLAEGSANEKKDEGLQKIREKAHERAKAELEVEVEKNEQLQAIKNKVSEVSESSHPEVQLPVVELESAPAHEAEGAKVAMVSEDETVTNPEPTNTQSNAEAPQETKVSKLEGPAELPLESPVPFRKNLDKTTNRALEKRFQKAVAKAKSGKTDEAKSEFLEICQSGHAHSCHKFAWYEEQGGNPANASRFYKAACENGLGKACNNLAFQFEQKKDYGSALELYAKACTEKHIASCKSLNRIREEQKI